MTDPRRRLTWTVFTGVALGSTGLGAAYTVAPLIATEIAHSSFWSGLPGASALVGTAAGAATLSRLMAARGRRAGLTLGWALGFLGAVLAVLAARSEILWLFFVGLLLVGTGHSSNQLGRFAAADMHPPGTRASVLGWIVWAGTIGAVLGPGLLGVFEGVAERLDLSTLSSGLLLGLVFYAAALVAGGFLRPDPSTLSSDDAVSMPMKRAPLRRQLQLPFVRVALIALVTAQAAMVLVMTMTPLHLHASGHALASIGGVMSAHFIGMFAFAPVMGKLTDRFGHAPMIIIGTCVLLLATFLAAASPSSQAGLLALCLFLLGVGWAAVFVAGSALLTHGLSYAERVRIQGSVDAVVWSASAVASFTSGIVLHEVGYAWMCLVGSAIAVLPAAAALLARRTAEVPAG